MNVYEKLVVVQTKLNAPKSKWNKFGGYYYRSCEDILESCKPLLKEVNASLFLSDEIVQISDTTEAFTKEVRMKYIHEC